MIEIFYILNRENFVIKELRGVSFAVNDSRGYAKWFGWQAPWLLMIGLFFALNTNAQTPMSLLLSPDSSYKSRDAFIMFRANGIVGSNALDNLFVKKSFYGGHLENNHLNHLVGNMRDQNRAGFVANAAMEFMNFRDTLFGHPEWGLKVDISTNYHGGLNFGRDLYRTIYLGNQAFAGDTADLGQVSFQYQAWQKFGIGCFNKHTLSGITLSLVEGQSYQSLIVSEASLYTSQNGDSLALAYTGEYFRSDTSKTGWANGSGLGAALDMEYNLPLNGNLGVISVAVRDLGFVVWSKASDHFAFDSVSTWTGINLENVFDFATDTLDFPNLTDSVYSKQVKKKMVAPLPTTITLRYNRHFNERDYVDAGIIIWPSRAAVPLIYAGLSHFITERLIVSERVSIGGYGRFGIGAEIQWMPAGSWLLRAGTNSLAGWTMSSAKGRDVFFTVGKSF